MPIPSKTLWDHQRIPKPLMERLAAPYEASHLVLPDVFYQLRFLLEVTPPKTNLKPVRNWSTFSSSTSGLYYCESGIRRRFLTEKKGGWKPGDWKLKDWLFKQNWSLDNNINPMDHRNWANSGKHLAVDKFALSFFGGAEKLGAGFNLILLLPLPGKRSNLTHIFFKGLFEPPTR